jgi:hypothetical protein
VTFSIDVANDAGVHVVARPAVAGVDGLPSSLDGRRPTVPPALTANAARTSRLRARDRTFTITSATSNAGPSMMVTGRKPRHLEARD